MSSKSLLRLRYLLVVGGLMLLPIGVSAQQVFMGAGTSNATAALNSFRAAIGGVNNGGTAAPQTGGRREINWDGVTLNGADFGGNTTVIVPNKVVGIPVNRFQTRGVLFGEVYAVSGDGFLSVNPGVAGQLNAFSPSNIFAMFNETSIEMSFATPSNTNTTALPAASRGLGVIFLDVETANTSSIEYFHHGIPLGKFYVPPGPSGQPEFLGVLFNGPTVTDVVVTPGTTPIFNFQNGTVTSGPPDNPTGGADLAATDDFVYAEPVPFVSWQAIDTAVGSDNKARLLWRNLDGRADVWSADNNGGVAGGPTLGPYSGYTPSAIAAGADSYTRVLWNKTDGTAALFFLDSNNNYLASYGYGPYPGWKATDITVGSDNKTRMLWTNTDGSETVWTIDNAGSPTYGPSYGPYTGYTAVAVAAGSLAGSDPYTRVLWNKTDGTAALWFLDASNNYLASYSYGPFTGWTAVDLAVGSDNKAHVLWTNIDGHTIVWSIDNAGSPTYGQLLGGIPGLTAYRIGAGGDGLQRVLANQTDGTSTLVLLGLDNAPQLEYTYFFGPF